MDYCQEHKKIPLTETKSNGFTRITFQERDNSFDEKLKKQSGIQFKNESSFSVLVADIHCPNKGHVHETLAAQHSIRSWFSLVANRSNRPSIFSKFREASGPIGLVYFAIKNTTIKKSSSIDFF